MSCVDIAMFFVWSSADTSLRSLGSFHELFGSLSATKAVCDHGNLFGQVNLLPINVLILRSVM